MRDDNMPMQYAICSNLILTIVKNEDFQMKHDDMKTAYLSSYSSHKFWEFIYVCIVCYKGKIVGTRTFVECFWGHVL